MPRNYSRRIYLGDTDAAGVVYFAKLLSICHEAYEEYLTSQGIDFGKLVQGASLGIPIVHAQIDVWRPLFCSDEIEIELTPEILSEDSFLVNYSLLKNKEIIGKAITKHIAIDPITRKRSKLTSEINSLMNYH